MEFNGLPYADLIYIPVFCTCYVALNSGTIVLISRSPGQWDVTQHLLVSGSSCFFMAHKTMHVTATHSSETAINTQGWNPSLHSCENLKTCNFKVLTSNQ